MAITSHRQFAVDRDSSSGNWNVVEILTAFRDSKVVWEKETVLTRLPSESAANQLSEKLYFKELDRVHKLEAATKKIQALEAKGVQFTLPTGSRLTTEPELDNRDPELKAVKREVYKALKIIAASNDWSYATQPWLHPQETHERKDTFARKLGKRVGQDGKVRPLMMSDLGGVVDCPRSLAASYAGVAVKVRNDERIYRGKGGTVFHAAIEGLLPEGIITETDEKAIQQLTGTKKDRTFTSLPSVGKLTEPTSDNGKKFAGIGGKIDAYLLAQQAGIEIKSVPLGDKLPEALPQRAFGQAACYSHAFNSRVHEFKPNFWVWVYLPSDLSKFNPEDVSTYRVFIRTREQLEAQFEIVWAKVNEVAGLVDALGYESAIKKLTCPKDGTGEHCDFCHVNWLGASTTTAAGQTLVGAGR